MILVHPLIALIAAPLLLGVINRTKAIFAGRTGPPLLQAWYDIARLLRKGSVYSETTTWVFRAGPVVGLAATLVALAFIPLGPVAAPFAFEGDLVFAVYLLGLARFVTVTAALDTGSSFEAMGASREVQISALGEPALVLALAVLAVETHSLSLSAIFTALGQGHGGPALVLLAVTLFILLLAECSRIPVDDPNTHLELTMVHEVMVLDHCGPDLAFIQYGAAVKLWVLGALVVSTALPIGTGIPVADLAIGLFGMLALAVAVGVVESSMARLRLRRLPQFLAGGMALAVLALGLVLEQP